MQTQLERLVREADFGDQVEENIGRCVHCGFCLATCPTYQILGDELDSPRGRIYQMKLVFEGAEPTRETQLHLDRCLTCRNCETTCPSGVEYGKLVDFGRQFVSERVERPRGERLLREGLRVLLGSRWFGPLYRIGQLVRPVLPPPLKAKVVARRPAGPAFKADAPYVVAVIDLDEGARMMTNIVTGDVEAVRIGQRVTVHYDDVTDEVTLPKFRLL